MGDTEIDEQKYKGFDLTEFADPDKVRALIDHLNLDGEVDEVTERGNNYSINPRKVKEGTSPAGYVKVIDAFKTLLTAKQRDKINSFLKLLSEMEDCECGKVKDKLYHQIENALQKKKLEGGDAWNICEKDALHVANILYHLLWLPSKNEPTEPDYVKAYREAWFGREVKDRRTYSNRDDGEYLILTDSEADKMVEDSIEDCFWEQAVAAKQTTLGLEDWKQYVIDTDGRGPSLALYDGEENEQDVDGTTYYIYRTN